MTPMSTPANNQRQSDHRLSRRKPPQLGGTEACGRPTNCSGTLIRHQAVCGKLGQGSCE